MTIKPTLITACIANISQPFARKVAEKLAEALTWQGSWSCYGAGEIGCAVYPVYPKEEYNYYVVAEIAGDNGSNLFYNPSGEAWVESFSDFSDERLGGVLQNLLECTDWYMVTEAYAATAQF